VVIPQDRIRESGALPTIPQNIYRVIKENLVDGTSLNPVLWCCGDPFRGIIKVA